MSEIRECEIEQYKYKESGQQTEWVKAYFHGWFQVGSSNGYAGVEAVVEFEDGIVRQVGTEEIRFTKSR